MIDTDGAVAQRVEQGPLRILLVDDDPGFRALLKTTFEIVDIEVDEADSVDSALVALGRWRPHAVILDVNMPGRSGLELCKKLKDDPATSEIGVVLLTGSEPDPDSPARQAGADAFLLKPFSPLELLAVVERLATGLIGIPVRPPKRRVPQEQLLLYARDLRQLLQIERQQRGLLQSAYRETVSALTSALESKDTGRGRTHSAFSTTRSSWPRLWSSSSTAIRAPSTGSSCTTSARSASRIGFSASAGRSTTVSGR